MSKYGKEVSAYLENVQKGDKSQLGKVFDLTANHLRVVAAKYLTDKSYCDDVVSDVFCKVMQYIHSFDPTQDGYNWLCKIAERLAYTYNANEKAQHKNTVRMDVITDIRADTCDTDGKMTLLSAMEILSQENREIIYDYFYARATYAEIAQKFGMAKSAIYMRVKKSLKKMKKFLKNGER